MIKIIRVFGENKLKQNTIRVEAKVAKNAEEFTKIVAEAIRDDIKDMWGQGGRPGIVTGNLNSSIMTDSEGRSSKGQFATGDNVKMWFVRGDARQGNAPDGRGDYAPEVEAVKPFMQPAIDRAQQYGPGLAKRTIKT